MRLTARALRLLPYRPLSRAESARSGPVRGLQVSRTVPENETEQAETVLRSRIRRFAKVEISAGFEAVPQRPELVHSEPDDVRLESRVLRFVHRRAPNP